MGSPLSRQLTHRFFRYLAITSQSDPKVKTLPSTPGQHDMARELAQELAQLGLDDIVIDDSTVKDTDTMGGICFNRRSSRK